MVMKIYNNTNLHRKHLNSVIAIGNFDGLHLGHQAILKQVKDKAKESSSASLVFFTEPHASEYFAAKDQNSSPPPRICPWREKVKLLKNFSFC